MDVITRLESQFDYDRVSSYMLRYWSASLFISAAYVVIIFSLQRWMRDRKPYKLQRWLFAWSTALTGISLIGLYRTAPLLLNIGFTKGWHTTMCRDTDPQLEVADGLPLRWHQAGVWSFLFGFSKLPELIDTLFIVLRKQKLIFLHWYHHITVFTYCWYYYTHMIATVQWFMVMNYFVHSFMYAYYALRAGGICRPPKWVNMFITTLQLLQMVGGVIINARVAMNIGNPDFYCDGIIESSYFHVLVSFAMYGSYFLLFLHFFYATYFTKPEPTTTSTETNGAISPKKID